MTPQQLYSIPFYNTEILTVQINGEPWVVLRHAFEQIGIDADRQIAKIQRQAWATTSTSAVVAADGKTRVMVLADVRTFLMALATIPVSRVRPEARELLALFQRESAKVIEAYWTRGAAINPRVAPEQVPAVVDQATAVYRSERERLIAEDEAERRSVARVSSDQIQLLGTAFSLGLIDEQWGKTKAQVILARGFGEAPAIAREDLPLYVEDFMKSKGVSQVLASRFSSSFGRKLVAHAVLEGIQVPGKRTQEMSDGTIREVTAWTKEHLPLFERAWNASYANDPRLFF